MPDKRKKAPGKNTVIVSVTLIGDRNATSARASMVHVDPEGEPWMVEGNGTSKRMPGDRYIDRVAVNLTVGRALENLGLQMQRTGEELVQSESDWQHATWLAARMRWTERKMRGSEPRKVLPLNEILEEYGLEAAELAAQRRGEELAGTPGTQVSEGYYDLDEGPPTVKSSNKKKEKS